MNWRLFHVYSAQEAEPSTEQRTNVFNAIAVLSSAEKDEIVSASRTVYRAHAALHIARAVTANLDDVLDVIVEFGEAYLRDANVYNDGFDDLLAELSRKLLNLCASFRSYLEHQETNLKRLGRSSPDWIAWRTFLSQIERDNKYYALIYGLRNYIQHVDMPPLHLNLHSENREEVTLSVDLVTGSLLIPTAQWSADMREFISTSGKFISLWEALKGWEAAFKQILHKNTDFRIQPARLPAEFILALRAKYGVPDYGMVGIAAEPVPEANGEISIAITWIEESIAASVIERLGGPIDAVA